MDSWAVPGDVVVRRSNPSCNPADRRRHFVPSASAGRLFGVVARWIVGTTPVDSLGTTGWNQCQGLNRLLLSGASVVLGIVESPAAVIVGACRTHVVFASDRHGTLY